jgi:DNA-binding transcriptional LysR family regulator
VDVLPRVDLLRFLPSDNYDIAIVALPLGNKIRAHTFASHPIVLMMHKDDELAAKDVVVVEDLVDRKLISLKTPSIMKRWLDDEFSRIGATSNICIEVNTSVLLPKLVSENLGVALVDWFAARFAERGNTTVRNFNPTLNIEYAHITSPQNISKSAQDLIDMLNTFKLRTY